MIILHQRHRQTDGRTDRRLTMAQPRSVEQCAVKQNKCYAMANKFINTILSHFDASRWNCTGEHWPQPFPWTTAKEFQSESSVYSHWPGSASTSQRTTCSCTTKCK